MRYGGAGGAGAGAGGADAGQGGRQRGAHPVVALPHPRPRHHAALNIPPPLLQPPSDGLLRRPATLPLFPPGGCAPLQPSCHTLRHCRATAAASNVRRDPSSLQDQCGAASYARSSCNGTVRVRAAATRFLAPRHSPCGSGPAKCDSGLLPLSHLISHCMAAAAMRWCIRRKHGLDAGTAGAALTAQPFVASMRGSDGRLPAVTVRPCPSCIVVLGVLKQHAAGCPPPVLQL